MKYISLNWTLALKFSIAKKKRMRDCRILMAHDCILYSVYCSRSVVIFYWSPYNPTPTENNVGVSASFPKYAEVTDPNDS